MEPQELLDQLDDDQRRVARQTGGALCVRAGAGTGKTRAITYRIAYGAATDAFSPRNVMALTFTRRAAVEMAQRLRDLGVPDVRTATFHAAALAQLKHFWATAVGGQPPQLLQRKASLVAAAASRVGVSTDRAMVSDLAREVEWAAVSMVDAASYASRATRVGRELPPGVDAATMAKIIDGYTRAKDESNSMDFEDCLTVTLGMLREREDICATVRAQYRHFVVDEFQDVSPLQFELLRQWLGGRQDLCVVGDAAQTIYSFAGATSSYLRNFRQYYPAANVLDLVRDYRSTPQVVALANGVIAGGRQREGVRLVAQRPGGPAPSFSVYEDDDAQAQGVAAQINRLHSAGLPLHDIAILYRTNGQSQELEAALAQAGISYQMQDGQRFFARPEIQASMKQLASIVGSGQEVPLVEAVTQVISENGWTPQPVARQGRMRERNEALGALLNLATQRHEDGVDLAGFVAEMRERRSAQAAPQADAVTLCTLHAAKGLEWEAVFLVGASEGLLPIRQASGTDQVEEERRLTYVGITRAKTHLYLSYAKGRPGRRSGGRKCSRFFASVWPDQGPGSARARPSSRRGARQQSDEFVANADPETLELFQQLRQWRALVSKGLGKPAYMVLTDHTLRAVAQARPKTLTQLRALPGIGPVKTQLLGGPVLALVAGMDPDEQVQRAVSQMSADEHYKPLENAKNPDEDAAD